ncbi:DUF475 domain-containing protein [Patescibacteria group bacterium]|nr:DUF475 domain-containing protein [Patescibacteria group bacterium]
MDWSIIILTILGLILFEVITSIDNAVINAEVLSGMGQKARRWFLTWGIFFAVFVVRGMLPWAIVYLTIPSLGPIGALTATFSGGKEIADTIEHSSGVLLAMGGTFLIFLFFNWLFMEPKNYGLRGERFFHKQAPWFYTIASIILTVLVWISFKNNPLVAFGTVLGSSIFFITHGFKQYAEIQEKNLTGKSAMSDISKVMYLEVIDTSFSIDGVIGAFAFTFAVPLIFLGNGIGAIVLRQLTIKNIDKVKKYKYLKNGAMYSILFLGAIMLFEAFGVEIPPQTSPIITFTTIGYFFLKSKGELNKQQA